MNKPRPILYEEALTIRENDLNNERKIIEIGGQYFETTGVDPMVVIEFIKLMAQRVATGK